MSGNHRQPRIARGISVTRRAGFVLVLALVVLLVTPVTAGLVRDVDGGQETDPHAVFEEIRSAWEREDQQALAELVHKDGLQVNNPSTANRYVSYSPSQAFYYFKNLFQNDDTDAFILSRVQETEDSPRLHALVHWHHHRVGSQNEETLRLMIVLTREDDGWGLAEINTIR